VFSLACHITGDDRQAEEITQDVFVQVWNHADSYTSDRGKVTTWLTSIARHRAIDVLRRIDRRPEGHQLPWEDGLLNAQGNSEAVEDQIEFSVEKEILSKSIAQLPGEQRQVLALAYFQGYSHSEIAVATGEALGTIKTRIRLAMKKLRQALEERRL
jgi:RNA polymerase sigma-70 factor (ECF subfamily)